MKNIAGQIVKLNEGMFTSKGEEWETPQLLFNRLDRIFNFTLDPCATPENTKCRCYYTIADNGLERSWKGHRVFMNPPYGNEIAKWVKKAYEESSNALIVGLLPARTDTQWWHNYCENQFYVLVKGRLKFSGKGSAPFPSAIVIFADMPREAKP